MADIIIDKRSQEIDEQLSAGLSLDPKHAINYYTDNIVQRVLGYLLGWNYLTGEPVKLTTTPDGLLRVVASGAGLSVNETHSGIAGNSWSGMILFFEMVSQIDVHTWDHPLFIQRSIDGITFQDMIEMPADSAYSMNASTRGYRIMNAVNGMLSRYQIIGWR